MAVGPLVRSYGASMSFQCNTWAIWAGTAALQPGNVQFTTATFTPAGGTLGNAGISSGGCSASYFAAKAEASAMPEPPPIADWDAEGAEESTLLLAQLAISSPTQA